MTDPVRVARIIATAKACSNQRADIRNTIAGWAASLRHRGEHSSTLANYDEALRQVGGPR